MASIADNTVPRHADGESFAHLIARRRRQLGLSQRDLADRVCAALGRTTVTRHELSRYERDVRRPRRSALEALAASLDVPLLELQRVRGRHGIR
ncbi:helix-turn-helix transcriptional regulator [Dactylosporangium roseum]|uniref:Helix-turn-helix transcriptional regulator n=1 Tax=Dactylosporangium roseum TaxID=47989 RepID=A0ABY5Z5H4_9ACTN|nr:helix-turn-helix transcriptional regulator [Dactylosporangium roseum]